MQRIISHIFWLGTLSMDLGQPTIFVWAMRERERLLDIFEDITLALANDIKASRLAGVTL